MSIKCQVVMDSMDKIAPRILAESWDNVGLLIGSPAQNIERILVCLDVSEAVIERAVQEKYDLIIAHHPLIFKPIKNLRTDLPLGHMLSRLLKHDIAVYAAHTNLDTARGGVNDVLTELLLLKNVKPLDISYEEELVKLAVFVPVEYKDIVQTAIGNAGAGQIGNYSHCSFSVIGAGQFLPLAEAKPFKGKCGVLETVNEIRLETILPAKFLNKVVKAMLKVHPYESVGYDVYSLKNKGNVEGMGRIGELSEPTTIDEFAKTVKNALSTNQLRVVKSGNKVVRKVALCSGSGAEFIGKAAYAGADVFITGDVKYHEAQRAVEQGIHLIDAGHFGTEMPVVQVLAERLRSCMEKQGRQVEIIADDTSRDFFTVI